MAEIITKDCKEYHIWDKVNGVWNRLFFKTNAKSVEADDGNNMQTKCGAINGISSSSTATDENIAASIGYVNQELNQINSDLANGEISFSVVDGEPYVKVGADSPRPFKKNIPQVAFNKLIRGNVTVEESYTVDDDGYFIAYCYCERYFNNPVSFVYLNDTPLECIYYSMHLDGELAASCIIEAKKYDVIKFNYWVKNGSNEWAHFILFKC